MSLLLMGSQCVGTGIIGLLTLGHDCVLQEKQKKIGNKYSVLMIGYGDRGHHHSKQRLLWGKMRVAELSWVVPTCCVLSEILGKCFVPVSSAVCVCLVGHRAALPVPGLETF